MLVGEIESPQIGARSDAAAAKMQGRLCLRRKRQHKSDCWAPGAPARHAL